MTGPTDPSRPGSSRPESITSQSATSADRSSTPSRPVNAESPGPKAPEEPKSLTQAMNHASAKVRLSAVDAIAKQAQAHDDAKSFRILTELLSDSAPEVRAKVALSLGQLKRETAYQPLVACLKDGDITVRKAAVEALGQLGNVDAIAALEPLERDVDLDIQAIVQRVIAQLMEKVTVSDES